MKGLKHVRSLPGKPIGRQRQGRRYWGRGLCAAILLVPVAFAWQSFSSSPDPAPSSPKTPGHSFDYPDILDLKAEYLGRFMVKHHVVQPGDTLNQILQDQQMPSDLLGQWQKSCPELDEVSRLRPGDELAIFIGREDQVPVKCVYTPTNGSSLTLRRTGSGWECGKDPREALGIVDTVRGTITDSLYDSCLRAGLPAPLIMSLADLFAYDVDFTSDVREGDTFAVHFEEQVKDGRRVHTGPILAAEIEVNGDLYQAFLYRFSDGYTDYFDAEGNSLRKLFLKAPLSYSRISSTFTYKRLHPILRTFRPHLGIDYAAPAGTPVSSLGDGTVTFMGRKGGFGSYLEVRHSEAYKTTYGHLLRFEKGLHTGSRVSQGEVIGYVGSSGLATGPHLDFRFFRNGAPIDFLKTDFPHARSVPQSMLSEFAKKREIYLAALRGKRLARARGPGDEAQQTGK